MEDIIQQIIERITEHLSNNDVSDEIIDKVIDNVNDSVTSYMEGHDGNIEDGIQNVINSIYEGAAQLTNLSFGSNGGHLIDPHIDFSDLFNDAVSENVEVDSSFFTTEVPGGIDQSDISFGGHSQEEINNQISKAEIEIQRQESNIQHHKRMIEIRTKDNLPTNLEQSHLDDAKAALQKAKNELSKWSDMKPDKSN